MPSAAWLRGAYHNGLKHGAIGVGVAVASRDGIAGREYALIIEVLAMRPVKLDTRADLRIVSTSTQPILVLSPSRETWAVPSSSGAKINGSTAYSLRQAYPVTIAQLQSLRGSEKPVIQVIHAEGMTELKLRGGELESIDPFIATSPLQGFLPQSGDPIPKVT